MLTIKGHATFRNSFFFANSRFNDHAPLAHYDPIEVDLVQMYGDHFYAAKSKDLYPGNDSEVSNAFFFKAYHSGLEIWFQEKMFIGQQCTLACPHLNSLAEFSGELA